MKFLRDFLTIWGCSIAVVAGLIALVCGIKVMFAAIAAAWGMGAAAVVGAVLMLGVVAALTAAMPDGFHPL